MQFAKAETRVMTTADAERGAALAQKIGWGQSTETCGQMIRWAGDGAFCLEQNGELIASAVALTYDTTLAWIGMVITHPEYQGRGLARQMMQTSLDYLREKGVRNIMLDASQMGYPLYDKLGFRSLYKVEVFAGSTTELEPNVAVRKLTDADLPGVIALDTQLFGVARPTLIREVAAASDAWVMGEPDNIQGYLLTKRSNEMVSIGPWYHENAEGAEALFRHAVSNLPETEVNVHIPEANADAKAIVERYGLTFSRFTTRMILEGDAPGEMVRQYSVLSLGTG